MRSGARDAPPERVLVLSTLGAPQRRGLRGRRGRKVEHAEPEPVPTVRATLVLPEPFADNAAAVSWLASMQRQNAAAGEIATALRVLNRCLHAHRAARADPYAHDVSADAALVTRLGYGAGDAVAEGRFADAWELPRAKRGPRRSMEAPEERFAALLGAREEVLACEELVLRARADLEAGRLREAALQARVGLEALLSEMPRIPGDRRPALEAAREYVGTAANAALVGDLSAERVSGVNAAVDAMEAALRARRLGSAT